MAAGVTWQVDGPPDPLTRERPASIHRGTYANALDVATQTGWPSFTITGPDGEYVFGTRADGDGGYDLTEGQQDALFETL